MAHWRLMLEGLVVIALLFFAIPVKVPPPQTNQHPTQQFHSYIQKFNKSYQAGTPEYDRRFNAFQGALSSIEMFNSQRTHNHTAVYGLTQFSDLTTDEFLSNHLIKPKNRRRKTSNHINNNDNEKEHDDSKENSIEQRKKRQILGSGLPPKMDWRLKGIISDVKSQGLCGACWAFSTIHTVEAMYAKAHNLTSLSVQQMIDCAKNGNLGCMGGDICTLLEWLLNNNITIQTEKEYPLVSKTDSCRMKTSGLTKGVHIKKYSCFSLVGTEIELLKWLANNGPVAVAINALSWQNYLGGVIQHHCIGLTTSLNHAVQIVGYDLTAEIPYYIAKNSWGTSFGNKGYVHLAIGENICGLANEVSMIDVA